MPGKKIAFFGPECTFSHQAALKLYPNSELLAEKSIQDCFEAVEQGKAGISVVPVENSTEGSVNVTLDLLADAKLSIIKETSLKIEHCLLSNSSMEKIKTVYSHPQALAQCRHWLEKNLPKAELSEATSTSKAAEIASGTENSAAISSRLAAGKYKVKILKEAIQDNPNNYTRFLAIGEDCIAKGGKVKTSILFATKHKPGSLFDALKAFKVYDLNLTRIESRPSKKNPWEYLFFVDFEGSMLDEKIKKAMEELKEHCSHFKLLGSFEVVE